MQVKWLVEHDIFDEDLEPLIAEIKRQGMEVEQIKYLPFESGSYDNFGPNDCVLCYGSLNLIRQLQRQKPWVPGSFCTLPNFQCSKYYAYFGKYLLNAEYRMMPLAELKRRKDELFRSYQGGSLSSQEDPQFFVRPSSGFKTFTGQIVRTSHFDADYELLAGYGASPDELVVVAGPRRVRAEWRFVICQHKVITGSLYKPHQQPIGDNKEDAAAWELAMQIAHESWQPDPMWTLDICKTSSGLFLLEINSFSCSGFYACDVEPIVREASRLAMWEWKDINDGGQ